MSTASSTRTFAVNPLTVRIGAAITGIDLHEALSHETVAKIRQALLTHKVLFFPGQNIGIEEQTRFAEYFGETTESHPTVGGTNDARQVYEIDSKSGARADEWHTDVTYTDRPPAASVLRGVTIPPYGGDTLFANTVTAYGTLPESLRAYLDTLRVLHSNGYGYLDIEQAADEAARQHMAEFASSVFVTEHPLVRVHPETQERSLLLGVFAQRVTGLPYSASRDLIDMLQAHITVPENTVRWHWTQGDVIMWDNRATEHYAVHDYGDTRRIVQRITLAGAIPVGVDGRTSRPLQGDASGYSVVGRV